MRDRTLSTQVLLFSRFLKDRGFRIFYSNVIDTLKSLKEIDVTVRDDFYAATRANLVKNEIEWRLFDELFETFWENRRALAEGESSELKDNAVGEPEEGVESAFSDIASDVTNNRQEPSESAQESIEGRTYSPVSLLEKKDLGRFEKGDLRFAPLILKRIMSPFRVTTMRRKRKSRKSGDLDFRRIIGKSLNTGGMPLTLYYKTRKKRLKRLVVLADVSGSMDRYARFVMPFILGLKGVGPKTEVFVFSTSLTPITPVLRRFQIDKALEIIADQVPEWSGGTRIGFSFHQFNEQFGVRLLNHRTVIVILSDGWDLGGKELLKREMEAIHQKAYAVIWLNPLLGDADYRPVCKGMQTALPFVDYFLPANSLESLKRVGSTISRIMVHG